jgi:hypothetical protein
MTNRLAEIKERWPDNVLFEVNRKDMIWLITRVEKLTAALEFYADGGNYYPLDHRSLVCIDLGERARKVLEDE